jgi:hypothetical protein
MPYKQYTHCIEKSDFDSFWNLGGQAPGPIVPLLAWGILQGLKDAILAGLTGLILGGPIGAGIGASIGFTYGMVEGFCDQWLNRRLICIQKNVCAVGRVAWQENPKKKDQLERFFDNDASLNLRLVPYEGKEFPRDSDAPSPYDWTQMASDSFIGANLVRQVFTDLNYKGYDPDNHPNHPGGRWTLHCEFEGNAMVTLCTIAKALALLGPLTWALGPAVGAVVGAVYGGVKAGEAAWHGCKNACSIPILCDIVCAIVAAVAAVVGAIVGAIVGALVGLIPGAGAIFIGTLLGYLMNTDGSFGDAMDPGAGNVEDEDCVFLVGDHVYDAGHSDGWHELHPVKHLQKICALTDPAGPQCCPHAMTNSALFSDPSFKDTVQRFWDEWCMQYKVSQDPLTVGRQGELENQWCLHPLVDGCARTRDPDLH